MLLHLCMMNVNLHDKCKLLLRTMLYYSFHSLLIFPPFYMLFFILLNVAYCDHRIQFFGPSPFPTDPMDPLLSASPRCVTVIIFTDPDPDPSVNKQKIYFYSIGTFLSF
jgi:hypothetical protein